MSKKRIQIVPYKMGSASAANLKGYFDAPEQAVDWNVTRVRRDNFNPTLSDKRRLIINWGCPSIYDHLGATPDLPSQIKVINPNTSYLANKLFFFEELAINNVRADYVPWTKDPAQAKEWSDDGHFVVKRLVLNGHSGNGIKILPPGSPNEFFTGSHLYTRYIKKAEEYRVHFVKPKGIIAYQQKRLRHGTNSTDATFKIRNAANGWVFCRNDVALPSHVTEITNRFLNHPNMSLDFGALDIIYNAQSQRGYILEVNTAPGLAGQTIKDYAEAFKEVYNHYLGSS